jgi:dienelactone hydrolase
MPLFNKGKFITIKGSDGLASRAYVAGPEDAKAGILFIHDYFGISDAARESVERLGALGYLTIGVDLYKGRAATTNDSAVLLMKAKDSAATVHILTAGIDYLKKPGRKLAAIGFSAGGIDAMKATLMEPELFSATIIVYGGDFDKIEGSRLDKLRTPVLAITGSLDNWALPAALNFLKSGKGKSLELYVYPGADHGYAQPLFNDGKNYDVEATRITWMLMNDFLSRHLNLISN